MGCCHCILIYLSMMVDLLHFNLLVRLLGHRLWLLDNLIVLLLGHHLHLVTCLDLVGDLLLQGHHSYLVACLVLVGDYTSNRGQKGTLSLIHMVAAVNGHTNSD